MGDICIFAALFFIWWELERIATALTARRRDGEGEHG